MNPGQLPREARRQASGAQQYEIIEMTAQQGLDTPIRAHGATAIGPCQAAGMLMLGKLDSGWAGTQRTCLPVAGREDGHTQDYNDL